MKPHVAVITLGVRDLKRSRQFYSEGLGWPVQQEDDNWVCFLLGAGSSALALYPWDELAEDAQVPAEGSGFRGVTLAHNVRSEARVDQVLAEAEGAGGSGGCGWKDCQTRGTGRVGRLPRLLRRHRRILVGGRYWRDSTPFLGVSR